MCLHIHTAPIKKWHITKSTIFIHIHVPVEKKKKAFFLDIIRLVRNKRTCGTTTVVCRCNDLYAVLLGAVAVEWAQPRTRSALLLFRTDNSTYKRNSVCFVPPEAFVYDNMGECVARYKGGRLKIIVKMIQFSEGKIRFFFSVLGNPWFVNFFKTFCIEYKTVLFYLTSLFWEKSSRGDSIRLNKAAGWISSCITVLIPSRWPLVK